MNSFRYLFIFIVILFILYSCNSESPGNIGGTYVSENPSFVRRGIYFLSNTWYTIGDSLELMSDSTFFHQTCGNSMTGNWRIQNDSLFLFCHSDIYRIDSLNSILKKADCEGSILKYKIENDRLILSRIFNDHKKYYSNLVRKVKQAE